MNKVEPDGGASELQLGSEVRAAVAVNADVELGTRVGGDTELAIGRLQARPGGSRIRTPPPKPAPRQ